MAYDSKEQAEALRSVRAIVEEWRSAVNAGDIDWIARITADDFEIMLPGQPALKGGRAREFFQGLVSQFNARVPLFTNEEIILCGDWAIHRLTYDLTLTPKGEGNPTTERGDSIHIFHREAAGPWRLVKDISTSFEATHALNAVQTS